MIGIYIRESSLGQEGNWTHQIQKEKGLEFALAQREQYQIFEDIKSGKSGSIRKQWNHLKEDIEAGKITTLYFWRYERLGRDGEENEKIKKLLLKHNVKFYQGYSNTYLDLHDSGVDLVTTMTGKMAEIENKNRAKYVKDALDKKADMGERRYSGRLFGYYAIPKIITIGSKEKIIRDWFVHEDEAKIIRRIFDLAIKHKMGLSGICRTINDEGCRTREGKLWTHDKIRLTLRHSQYAGLTHNSKKELIKSTAYPAIISEAEYREMQRKYPELITTGKKGHPNEHLASGLMKCSVCGSSYSYWKGYSQRINKEGEKIRTPKISYVHNARISCTGRKYYNVAVIDTIMNLSYRSLIGDKEFILAQLEEGMKSKKMSDETIERYQNIMNENAKRIKNLYKAIEAGLDFENTVNRIKELQAENNEAKIMIEKQSLELDLRQKEHDQAVIAFQTMKLDEYQQASDKEKNKLLRKVIGAVYVTKDQIKVVAINGVKEYPFLFPVVKDNLDFYRNLDPSKNDQFQTRISIK